MGSGSAPWGLTPWGGAPSVTVTPGQTLDVAAAVADTLYRLGFRDDTEIASTSWVNLDELFQWADDAVRLLAWKTRVFLTYDTSISVVGGTAQYSEPTRHVFTVAAWCDAQPLRITSAAELAALDGTWRATTGAPKRASFDAAGVGPVTLYPKPTVGATLAQVCQIPPAEVTATAARIGLPAAFQDYFAYAALAGARGKESEARMPEVAEHCRQRCAQYEQLMLWLYGEGQ